MKGSSLASSATPSFDHGTWKSQSLTALMQISSDVSKELVLSIIIFTVGVTLGFGGTSSLFSSSYITTAFLVFVAVLTGDAVFYNTGLYPLVYLVFLLLDQSFWQGILSSEPETSGFNLIASGLFFLPVGTVFGTACGLGYFALNMSYGQVMLSSLMERLGKFNTPHTISFSHQVNNAIRLVTGVG
ncbi:hypothetical protein TSMEX_010634 [Taenia solium]|eukprot:TsM_000917600 transcript=TsM_000917600 gene=TsM_000917600